MLSKTKIQAAVSAGVLAVSALIACSVPFTHPETDFFRNMLEATYTGGISGTFLPVLYPWLASVFYGPYGIMGVVALQALLYLGVTGCVFTVLYLVTGHGREAIVAATLIALDPDLLLSIGKLWDTEATVFFAMLLLTVCLFLAKGGRWANWAFAVAWGLGIALRPNFSLLVFPFLFALHAGHKRNAARYAFAALAVAFAVTASVNTHIHGALFFPRNGPYNLFAGANPHTASMLLKQENAEGSIDAALRDAAVAVDDTSDVDGGHRLYEAVKGDRLVRQAEDAQGIESVQKELRTNPLYNPSLNQTYSRLAIAYIVHHPLQWIALGGTKLITLLRPDLKAHEALSGPGAVKVATSLCWVVWIIAVWHYRRFELFDRIVLIFILSYMLPFLLTNADPRFRPALDIIFLTHAAALAMRGWAKRDEKHLIVSE